jgi:flagellar motor switch protein FliN/FliY
MSGADDPLLRLGQSTGEAVSGVLEMFAPGQVSAGSVDVVSAEHHPLEGIPTPAVLTSVSYIDGVTGGNLFVMSVTGARKLAAAMMGTEPGDSEEELTELELSAVAEAMNQMMASAAIATSEVLGTEVEIGVPETKTFSSASEAVAAYERTPHTVRAVITVCGEPCRLVQLVPNAFVVRMTRALDEMGAEYAESSSGAGTAAGGGEGESGGPSLTGIPVRVWAELGRAQMPSAQIVALPAGAVVELDRQADEPIDLYVNGMRFASGRLIVVDGSDWAVRIDTIFDLPDAVMPADTETSPQTNDIDIPNPQEVA